MELSNSRDDLDKLVVIIRDYYRGKNIHFDLVHLTPNSFKENDGWYYWDFLLDRRYVIRYSIGPNDRGRGYLGGLQLAIGPYFFDSSQFWGYENSEHFHMGVTKDDIHHNLQLLDQYLETQKCTCGCPNCKK